MAMLMAVAFVMVFVVAFVLIPTSKCTPFVQEPEASLAGDLANQIKPLPLVGDTSCQGVSTVAANTITILQDMDRTIGTGFGALQFDASQCDVVAQYVPIVGSYDSLVLASRSLDPNNSTSVKVFYEDAFLLSSDFIIINDGVAYKVAFKSTGELNNDLGLATLRSVCGDSCYRVVLSGIHWTIRVYMDQFLSQFESWLPSQLTSISSPSCG